MQPAIAQLIADLHPDDVMDFEERSSIAEIMGGLSREDADKLALSEVMSRRMLKKGEKCAT